MIPRSSASVPSTPVLARHEPHAEAPPFPFADLPDGVQRHVMSAFIDAPMREARFEQLAGILLADKKTLARAQDAIADRLCNPTDEQRCAWSDRELGFRRSRARFERLKSLDGDAFRQGVRELLNAHRHIEISFGMQTFAEKDVFGDEVRPLTCSDDAPERAEWQRLHELRRFRSLIRGRNGPGATTDGYLPTLAEHRVIVVEELAKAKNLANLRWNASCPRSFKPQVLQLLDDFARRDDPRARPRIELMLHQERLIDAPGEPHHDAFIDNDDFHRLAANPLIERLDLSTGRIIQLIELELVDALRRSSLTALRLAGYELRDATGAAASNEWTTKSKLESFSIQRCNFDSRDGCDRVMSKIARCEKLRALCLGHSTYMNMHSVLTERVMSSLRTYAIRLERLSAPGWSSLNAVSDAGLAQLLGIRSLKSLRLSHNRIGADGAALFAVAALQPLYDHPCLEEIDLSHNFIDAAAAEALVNVPCLKRINLKRNPIDPLCAEALARRVARDVRVDGCYSPTPWFASVALMF